MKLWDRIKRGMDAGFDAAISAVHNITEKAGESIELTRLRREKTRLEIELTKHLAELGNAAYEKISESRLDEVTEQLQIKEKMLEIAREEAQMVEIDRRLSKEIKKEKEIESPDGK
jgi:dihydropteroate synthase